MKDDRDIFTLDSNTVASNPGRVKVMPLVLMRHIHQPIFLLIALLASLAFALDVSLIIGGNCFSYFFSNKYFLLEKKKRTLCTRRFKWWNSYF